MNPGAAACLGEGLALLLACQPGAALLRLREAWALDPTSPDTAATLGFALSRLGREREAAVCYRQALALDPLHPAALCNLGELARAGGDLPRARSLLAAAAAAQPGLAEAHSNLGLVLVAQGEIEPAIDSIERAVGLQPGFAAAWSNLAHACLEAGRAGRAVEAGRRAVHLAPLSAEAHWNLGLALGASGRQRAAIASLRRALALDPGNARIHWNLALALLGSGQWREGWQEWEWRFAAGRSRPLPGVAPRLTAGDTVAGQTVALYSEQGLGDTLQFLRYAQALERAGARVDLAVQEPVAALLTDCRVPFARIRVNRPGENATEACFEAGLLSLAGIAGTRVSNVPPPGPALELPSGERARWHEWAAGRPRPLTGFAWRGNPSHPADRFRSLPDDAAAGIAAALGPHLVSLQLDAGSPARTLTATAALIAELDLVITADTMVAHLAGLVGTPVWILLAATADWRWLSGRDSTPWYPRARLFRQQRPGDWSGPVEAVCSAIAAEG